MAMNSARCLSPSLAFVLIACSGAEISEVPDAAQPADASVADAGTVDASISDSGPADSGVSPVPACPERITWGLGPEFPEPRDHHATFVWTGDSGPSLYVAGGFNGGVFSDVWRAPIMADGALGDWQDAGQLHSRTSGMALAKYADRVYLLGGHSGASRLRSTSSFTISEDGVVTDTRAEADLPQPRFHASAAVFEDYVFVSGGLGTPGVAEDSIFRARFASDGTLGAWTSLGPMPEPRSHHSSFVQDGFLYLVGGFFGNPVGNRTTYLPNVLRAEIMPDGTLGPWQDLGITLPAGGVSTHASATFEGCALNFAGITDAPQEVSDGVVKLDLSAASAEVLPDSAMPVPRSHVHHAPVHSGFVYLVSGKDTFSSDTAAVLVGRLQ